MYTRTTCAKPKQKLRLRRKHMFAFVYVYVRLRVRSLKLPFVRPMLSLKALHALRTLARTVMYVRLRLRSFTLTAANDAFCVYIMFTNRIVDVLCSFTYYVFANDAQLRTFVCSSFTLVV